MKTFILAPDSFKESMTAEQACFAMQRGIEKVIADAQFIHVPMADGGEGTVDALVAARNGRKVAIEVSGPLTHQRIQTYFGLIENDQTAVIEMAMANGIHLIEKSQRNPLITSTLGTGEMIKAALDLGVTKIIIGLGGSVTNDAGAGMAQALGAKFLDQHDNDVALGGGQLNQIQRINISNLDSRLKNIDIIIASDVNNPLCGENGASVVFAPQKGASTKMVEILEQNLQYFAELVESTLNLQKQTVAGAGAAGGLGFGLMAFAGATIRSGVEIVIEETKLAEKIAQADYVFTGEGGIDFQTKFGKTPFGVAQLAQILNKPVIAFAGVLGEGIDELYQYGFSQIISINTPESDLATALKNGEQNLEISARSIAEILKRDLETPTKRLSQLQ